MAAIFGLVCGAATLLACRSLGMDSGAMMRGPAGISLPAVDAAWVLSILAGLFGGTITAKYPWMTPFVEWLRSGKARDIKSLSDLWAFIEAMVKQFTDNKVIVDALHAIANEITKMRFEEAKRQSAVVPPAPKSPFGGR